MPIGRSEGLSHDIGFGYSALDAEASRNRLDGFAVVDGLGVTVSTGLTVSIASGTAIVGETSGTVDTVSLGSSTTATLDTADSTNPRKDTIYIDTNGAVQVETGVAEAADPSGNTRFNTFQPEPPLPSTEGVILAEVWVGAGTSSLASADIRDRRQPADIVADDLTARTVTAGDATIGNVTVSQDRVGSLSEHQGDGVSVSGNSWQTIFDVTDTVDVIGGHVTSWTVTRLRITWSDGTTDEVYTSTFGRGDDEAGDRTAQVTVPPIKEASKLEFFNGSGVSENMGWKVLTI